MIFGIKKIQPDVFGSKPAGTPIRENRAAKLDRSRTRSIAREVMKNMTALKSSPTNKP